MKYICCLFMIILNSSCSLNTKNFTDVLYCNMNKEIQDTLSIINIKILKEDYHPSALIDFTGRCKLVEKEFGPWLYEKQIEDTITKKKMKLPPNAPMPYIVYGNFIYYPYEYNLLVMGFDNNSVFKKIQW